jgi:recombination protein RecA
MSSAVFSTSAAQGRFFVFDAEMLPETPFTGDARKPAEAQSVLSARIAQPAINSQKSQILAGVTPASHLAMRPAPEMVSSGIAAIDAFTGGLPRGCLTEIFGPASSGRTTLLLAALAAATRRGEVCAMVDAGDALDPQSAATAGVRLDNLLWVRCSDDSPQRQHSASFGSDANMKNHKKMGSRPTEHRLEQLLRSTDLLLESGGFGLIALDLCDLPMQTARRIPLTTWFRFRRAVEHTPTVLLAIERQSIAGSCSSLLMKLGASGNRIREKSADFELEKPAHTQLLTELEITAEIARSRLERKPAASVAATFASKTAWAG